MIHYQAKHSTMRHFYINTNINKKCENRKAIHFDAIINIPNNKCKNYIQHDQLRNYTKIKP